MTTTNRVLPLLLLHAIAGLNVGTMGCKKTAPTPDATGHTVEGPTLVVPPPTEKSRTTEMRYFNWRPPAQLERGPQESDEELAARVLASAELAQQLDIRPDADGFVRRDAVSKTKDVPPNLQVVFRQVYRWRGKVVPVDEAFATVELAAGGALVYVGTGFRPGVSLPDKPPIDEARAADIATKDYAGRENVQAVSSPHRDPGLKIHRVRGNAAVKGDALGYQIHVEAKVEKGRFSRPFLYLIDAFTGEVLTRAQAWTEHGER